MTCNAAGGVVQLWSAERTPTPVTTLSVNVGGTHTFRYSTGTPGTLGADRLQHSWVAISERRAFTAFVTWAA